MVKKTTPIQLGRVARVRMCGQGFAVNFFRAAANFLTLY